MHEPRISKTMGQIGGYVGFRMIIRRSFISIDNTLMLCATLPTWCRATPMDEWDDFDTSGNPRMCGQTTHGLRPSRGICSFDASCRALLRALRDIRSSQISPNPKCCCQFRGARRTTIVE
jgi:hypothetical protein